MGVSVWSTCTCVCSVCVCVYTISWYDGNIIMIFSANYNSDIKKAKELSLQGPQTSQPASDCGLFFVGGSTHPEAQERPSKLSAGASLALSPFIPSQQTPELTMSPFSRPHCPSPPPSPLLSPFLVSPVSPAVHGAGQSSSSSSSSQGGANGDWDEEEMARALSLSLMNSTPPPPSPPPAPDTQDCELKTSHTTSLYTTGISCVYPL